MNQVATTMSGTDDDSQQVERDEATERKRKEEREELISEAKRSTNNNMTLQSAEYKKLRFLFERTLIMHKLARDFYGFRSFWLNFLPLTLVSTATTIIGFLISGGNASGVDGQAIAEIQPVFAGAQVNLWAILVGILGAISTLLTAIGKYQGYQSQYDMHTSAIKAMEKILLSVDFEIQWFGRCLTFDFYNEVAAARVDDPGKALTLQSKLAPDLKTHQASFKAMQDSCDSPIPCAVKQAFELLHNIAVVDESDDLSFFYNTLWNEFTTSMCWPYRVPNIKVMARFELWKHQKLVYLGAVKKEATFTERCVKYWFSKKEEGIIATEASSLLGESTSSA
jgi:hypothetical protein